MRITVEQILVGYCKEVDSPWKDHPEWNCCRASGSVSYVCTEEEGAVDVIFDLGSPWNRNEFQDAVNLRFQRNVANGWTRKKLFVVISHVHTDHIGNLDLVDDFRTIPCFSEVLIVCGQTLQGELKISEDIKVVETPGHTDHDISVIVNSSNLGKVAIAGDTFESQADLQDSALWKAVSLYPEEQEKSRSKLLDSEKVDFVIPGHGPGFAVAPEESVEIPELPEFKSESVALELDSSLPARVTRICESDESAEEVVQVEVGGYKILFNCGPQLKHCLTEEERSQVDLVLVCGSFMNAYCLGLFPSAQIVLGRDLAAPESVYTGDHIINDVFEIGNVLKLEFSGKNVTQDLADLHLKSRICGFK